jgi:hypothetical protein
MEFLLVEEGVVVTVEVDLVRVVVPPGQGEMVVQAW